MDVVLVDDHVIFRESLGLLLSRQPRLDVVAQFSNIEDLKAYVQQSQPHIVIIDYHMPGCDTLSAIKHLKARFEQMKLIVLTASQSPSIIQKLIDSSADAVAQKEGSAEQMLDIIQRVSRGERVVSDSAQALLAEFSSDLTNREFQVLTQIGLGQNNKEIGELLFISPKTVEKHRENLMKKLKVNSAVQLVSVANKLGLLQ